MSSQEALGLGKIITTPQERDAVHVAVAPVVALEKLLPGQRVRVVRQAGQPDGAMGTEGDSVGVVDPFLRVLFVERGQEFWLWLNPGSITSLRHDWTHPAFTTNPQLADHLAKKRKELENAVRT